MYLVSLALGLAFMMSVPALSWYFEIKPGGAMILIATVGMLLSAVRGEEKSDAKQFFSKNKAVCE